LIEATKHTTLPSSNKESCWQW